MRSSTLSFRVRRGKVSFPAVFLAAGLLAQASATRSGERDVVISEVHYHPPLDAASDEGLEFVELENLSSEPISIAGWTLQDGVDFLFQKGAAIGSRGFVVVARDAARVEAAYGLSGVLGGLLGKLSNGGEIITLRDGAGNLVDRVNFLDEDPWPENPDGLGPSLEKTDPLLSGENQASWRASIFLGGTPGRGNSTDVGRTHRTLIAVGSSWKYRKGSAEPSNPVGAWAGFAFNDAAWTSGPSGFGYGDGDDATVLSDMRGSYTTVYIRKKFSLASPAAVESLVLSIVYDDAYVAYLNGTEVGRSATAGGTPGTPFAFDATAAVTHNTGDGSDSIELGAFSSLLRAGDNVIALQILNESLSSSDLSMIPSLVSVELDSSAPIEPAHDLEINEVHAGSSPAEGFIELYNEGVQAADLSGFLLVGAPIGSPAYSFPAGTALAAGARKVVSGASLPFALTDASQWIGLVTPDHRFVDGVETRIRPSGRSWGRFPDGDGDTFVLDGPTSGAANTLTLERSVVINEVGYHPPLAASAAEYIELHNKGGQPLNLFGWRLDKAVRFTFSSVSIPSGGFLVISGNPSLVEGRHGITGVLGPWTGKLADSADKIELKDALGNRVDVVHYADDGRWPPSTAGSGPDGHGPSIELVNPLGENNDGVAWLGSTGMGTPGAQNSRFAADPAPVIRSTAHTPAMPRSQEAVTITARVIDDRTVSSVRVFSRVDGATTFTQATMFDDGAHGDGPAGDGTYGASLVKRANGTIVQFYVEATDNTAHVRKLPANAPATVCLYQVDDRSYPFGLPLYRAILRDADREDLETRGVDSNVLLDGTFVRGKEVFYNVGLRYRGDNSRDFAVKAFRIDFPHDQPFEGITHLNVNALDNHLADLAADFIRRADVPVFQTRPVAYTLNNAWQTKHGGLYLRVEAVDDELLARVFPGDDEGNLYHGRDPPGAGEADLKYLGPDPASYVDFYEKKTNEAENDYSDVIALTNAFTNTPDQSFEAVMEGLLDVDEWLRFFAVETVLNNQDGAIATDTGEDYLIYHRLSDGKWLVLPWDQNENFQDPTAGIFRMGIAGVRRLVLHPAFVGRYFQHVLSLLDGPFQIEPMTLRIDAARSIYAASLLDPVASFVPARQDAIRSLIPDRLTAGVEPLYFVRTGDDWRYFKGTREPSGGTTTWTGVSFDDTTWPEGPGGFGYGDGDDRTTLADMEGSYTTVYIRHAFNLANPASITTMTLAMRYDDGFIVWLNGTEIARRDFTGAVRFDSRADADHEADAAAVIDVSAFRAQLRTGKNVIAAAGINSSSTSSDLTLDPELYADPTGSGCGTRLFASGASISLGGTAPVLSTASVKVNGANAVYDPLTGRWHRDVTVAAGLNAVEVVALDAAGAEIEGTGLEVLRGTELTLVNGSLTTTRWTEAGGPFHVTGDVTIASSAVLTIDPGVQVYLSPGASIIVRGTLNANGTQAKPVAFQGTSCAGAWGGIAFLGSAARGTLGHVELAGASTPQAGGAAYPGAVSLDGGARVRIENSHLSDLRGLAVDAAQASQLTLLDCVIENAAAGVHAGASYADLEGLTIRNLSSRGTEEAGSCIRFTGESVPQSLIRRCVLRDAPGDGIDLEGASPIMDSTVISGCSLAVEAEDGSSPVLRHVTISDCELALSLFEKTTGSGGGHVTADSLILWGNGRSVLLDSLYTLSLTWSDVEGGYPGTGNADFDPLFKNAPVGDYHLRPGSPAIGTGKDGEDMGAFPAVGPPPGQFLRGDANADSVVDISDALKALIYLFGSATAPPCLDAVDANDSGLIDISDAAYLLQYLFKGGPAPPAPFPSVGPDPTPGDLYSC